MSSLRARWKEVLQGLQKPNFNPAFSAVNCYDLGWVLCCLVLSFFTYVSGRFGTNILEDTFIFELPWFCVPHYLNPQNYVSWAIFLHGEKIIRRVANQSYFGCCGQSPLHLAFETNLHEQSMLQVWLQPAGPAASLDAASRNGGLFQPWGNEVSCYNSWTWEWGACPWGTSLCPPQKGHLR